MERTEYYFCAYIERAPYDPDEPYDFVCLYSSDDYDDAWSKFEQAKITGRRRQINFYCDDGEETRKLAVKDEFGINDKP